MPNDNNQKPQSSVNLSTGRKTDAAIADILRGLLKKPSEELGSLLADSIGILGDRVKRKRQLNVENGIRETRRMLENRSVELKDITPPSEEDLYVLVEGMSVAGDDQVRRLWSGLLASALDPDMAHSIERPITSVLSALSPADSRIVHYAAFVIKNDISIQQDARKAAGVKDKDWLTVGEADRIDRERKAMGVRLTEYMESTSRLETEYNLKGIVAISDWSDNLVRLGIIQPKTKNHGSSTPNFRFSGEREDGKFLAILEHTEERIKEVQSLVLGGLSIKYLYMRDEKNQTINLGFEFSRFGEKLCAACGML